MNRASRAKEALALPILLAAVLTPAACRAPDAPDSGLDWLLGDWHGTRRHGDDGSAAGLRVRVEPLAEGHGQVERVQVEGEAQPYVGFAVRTPGGPGRWTMAYANATRDSISRLAGEVAGDRATWRSSTPGDARESRLEVERLGPDAWRRTQSVSEDGGRTWRVLFTDEVRRAESAPDIRVWGTLRAMFHEGRTGAAVSLATLLPDPHLFALGALAELAGEVTILAGSAHLAFPDGDGARAEVETRSERAAALLVAARVPAWRSVRTEHAIAFADLDAAIARLAAEAGLPADARVPFLLEGEFTDLRWHVIDGRRLAGGANSPQDHLAASVRLHRTHARGTLLGFYSPFDQGVFTQRSARTHIHCVLADPPATGHVDHVVVPAGTTVRFPAL